MEFSNIFKFHISKFSEFYTYHLKNAIECLKNAKEETTIFQDMSFKYNKRPRLLTMSLKMLKAYGPS